MNTNRMAPRSPPGHAEVPRAGRRRVRPPPPFSAGLSSTFFAYIRILAQTMAAEPDISEAVIKCLRAPRPDRLIETGVSRRPALWRSRPSSGR